MHSLWIEKEFNYDGSQLRPLFAYENYQLLGESIVAWQGPCNVANEFMKDGEDLFAGESIASHKMLHFIVELFEKDMFSLVSFQRLIASLCMQEILKLKPNVKIHRKGDDLYINSDSKLSISIASKGSISGMIHFAVNITNDGTPVKTACLEDLQIPAKDFAHGLMSSVQEEYISVVQAGKKVFSLK